MSRTAPLVSIVLPTYNRADVIGRAIASVLRQRMSDWELIVVDDGSTDGTAERVRDIDPQLVLVRQDNAGVYAARNAGLAAARGRYITFLDSDDEWTPHYLELTAGFLAHHPDEHFVTTEFLDDWGDGPAVVHDRHEIAEKYPAMARLVGSHLFDRPAGEHDDYLRVYSAREPVGPWGRAAAEAAGVRDAQLYRGHIFPHMRFGYLNWLPTTMLTRHALDTIGPFATHARSAADYHFLARLARAFRANMIAVPSATKYDRAPGQRALAQDHLASGQGAYRFEVNRLAFFEELYATPLAGDPSVELLRCHHALSAARAALHAGLREQARVHLREAARLQPRLWWAYAGQAFAGLAPSDELARVGYRAAARTHALGQRIARRGLRALRGGANRQDARVART